MQLALSRMLNDAEDDELLDLVTKAEYNQRRCGIFHNLTPYEAMLEYDQMIKEEERAMIYEKLY